MFRALALRQSDRQSLFIALGSGVFGGFWGITWISGGNGGGGVSRHQQSLKGTMDDSLPIRREGS